MVNGRIKRIMKEETRKALANLNHIGPDFRKSRKMNNQHDNDYSSSRTNTNTYVLKGGINDLSAYGGKGGTIDCEVYWDNRLPDDAFKVETN